jgi:hypothetical protein
MVGASVQGSGIRNQVEPELRSAQPENWSPLKQSAVVTDGGEADLLLSANGFFISENLSHS